MTRIDFETAATGSLPSGVTAAMSHVISAFE